MARKKLGDAERTNVLRLAGAGVRNAAAHRSQKPWMRSPSTASASDPGTLYALLVQFEEEGRKRSYRITPAGIQLLLDEYRRLLQMISDTKKAAFEDET